MNKTTKVFTRANAQYWPANLEKILRHYWQHSDKDLVVTVKENTATRSEVQNNLLWKWHGEFCEFLYQSRGELVKTEVWHEKMVPEYLPSKPVKIQGKWFTPRVETKKLKVKVFADFLTKYECEAAQEGCVFTRPEDLYLKAVMKDEK